MSPQLSTWIYGVSSSTYATEFRYGGFRPVVFLSNGLTLAFFLMTTVLAALALWRAKTKIRNVPPRGAAAYLAAIVVLTKSAGALLYTIGAGFLIGFTTPRTQIRVATVLVAIALLYPLLRAADVFPTKALIDMGSVLNEERGDSLRTRFEQEDALLARASERIMFGWGRYGRNRIYTEEWGTDISLTDGLWIITMGQFGLVGFLALFGLLSIPVFRATRALRHAKSEPEKIFLSSLALIVALTVVEQIPNASISPWSWLLTGVLLARTDTLRSSQCQTVNSKIGHAVVYHSNS
jgi:cell division protein FtsW (lipid II flippase)